MIQILALDFDGVIVDSLPVRDEGFRQAFSIYGDDFANKAKEFHVNHRGIFRKDKFKRIFNEILSISPTEYQLQDVEARFIRSTQKGIFDSPLLPGVTQLESLRNDIAKYIVSAAPEKEVQSVASYKGIDCLFKNIFGGPVSKKEILNEILSIEGREADSMLFIGDAFNDYKASVDVRCDFVGIVSDKKASPFPEGIQISGSLSDCISTIFLTE